MVDLDTAPGDAEGSSDDIMMIIAVMIIMTAAQLQQ